MDRYIAWILTRPKRTIGIVCVFLVVSGYYGISVPMDNSMEVWLPVHTPARVQYQKFIEMFGSEEFILIALHMPEGLTRDYLMVIQRLTRLLEKEKGIERVWSLSGIFDRPLKNFEIFKNIIAGSSFCRGTLISQDGKASGIIIIPSVAGIQNRRALVEKIRHLVARQVPADKKVFIAGPPVINVMLDRMSQRVSSRYAPLLFLVCLVVLLLLFRSFAGIAVPALMMGGSLLLTIGWMGICGASLNIITVACFPLIMVIALAYSLYVYNAYHDELMRASFSSLREHKCRAIVSSFRTVSLPIFLSAITTAVGFGSLMVSDITPVKHLGLFVALGILSAFCLAMTFLPSAILLFPGHALSGKGRGANKNLDALLRFVGMFAIRYNKMVLGISFLVIAAAAAGILRLNVETHILSFFSKDGMTARAYSFIENNLTGLSPIEIVIVPKANPQSGTALDPGTQRKIKDLQNYLENRQDVVATLSAVNIIRDRTGTEFLDLLFASKQPMYSALDAALREFINEGNEGRTATRVSVRARTLASQAYRALLRDIDRYLAMHFRQGARAYRTGIVPMIVDMQDSLLKNLLKSFAIAFGVICMIFLVLLRSVKSALISLIPNIIPVIVVLGFMGWFQIKLDVATVMIASIAIGIAVDDTLHFVLRFRHEKSLSGDGVRPILATLTSTGKTIVYTSLVTICGFIVLCFSGFNPMIYFGLLTSITILAALIGDIIILPALLARFKPDFTVGVAAQ